MIHNYAGGGFKLKRNNWVLPFIAIVLFMEGSVRISGQSYWMQRGGSTGADEGYSISTDGSNNTYTTGYFTGTASFGAYSVTASGVSDIFVAKTNSSGVYQWA